MKCQKYYDFLFNMTPVWEADILKDWFPPDDAWMGMVLPNPDIAYREVLKEVRRLSEGSAFMD